MPAPPPTEPHPPAEAHRTDDAQQPEPEASHPPLFVVKGEATAEEVAALTAVLAAVSASSGAAPPLQPRRVWAAAQRAVRPAVFPAPGGWRSSAAPR